MNIATILWGLTAILGRLISMDSFTLVWYRVVLVSISLLFMPGIIKSIRQLSIKSILLVGGIGILLCLHWVAWYGSIKLSNASVAVSCIACVSLFIAVLEPLFDKSTFQLSNILIGLMVIPGILFINQSLDLNYKKGFLVGIFAALLAAFYGILNKKYTQDIPPNEIMLVQMVCSSLFLTICLPFIIKFNHSSFIFPNKIDLIYLIILSVFCTAIPFNLFLHALKASDAFTTALINNLEPIYGIILAAILLGENKELNSNFYIGTLIILSAVFIHALLNNKSFRKRLKF
ncbi:MAG: DMT family transporter [Chitinophagales bacterium]|nr:DMT family transporter [Bacteroidota bacterium]